MHRKKGSNFLQRFDINTLWYKFVTVFIVGYVSIPVVEWRLWEELNWERTTVTHKLIERVGLPENFNQRKVAIKVANLVINVASILWYNNQNRVIWWKRNK